VAVDLGRSMGCTPALSKRHILKLWRFDNELWLNLNLLLRGCIKTNS